MQEEPDPLYWNWGLAPLLLWTKRDSIHRLTRCNKFFVNNSLISEECDQHNFVFCLLKSKLFALGRFISVIPRFSFCYGIILGTQVSYWVEQGRIIIHRLNKFLTSLRAFCSSVKECGTNLAQIFRFPRSSLKNLRIVSLLISSSASIIRRVIRRSVEINYQNVSFMSGLWTPVSPPLWSSSSRFSRPSRNLADHQKKPVYEREHCHHKPISSAEKFQ
jgi:hypothetical protein